MNRHPRITADSHLVWLRTLPSLVPGYEGPTEAAHLRFPDPMLGKRQVGMAEKPDDKWTVPLSAGAHRDQHSGPERVFWRKHGINPLYIAAFLWFHTGDDETAEIIISNARSIGQW